MSRPFSRPTQLICSTLLGLMTLGAAAQTASANPLQALPIVGSLLGGNRQSPPLPSNLGLLNDNVRNNNLNMCVLTCNTPAPSVPGAPSAGNVGSAGLPIPPGARPPAPSQLPPGARPPAPLGPNGRPNATLNLPPIQLPF